MKKANIKPYCKKTNKIPTIRCRTAEGGLEKLEKTYEGGWNNVMGDGIAD